MNQYGNEPLGYNRRDFLKSGSFATLMSMLGGIELFAETPASAPAESAREIAKIKTAVIGLGAWGREILSTLSLLEYADVVAICDTYGAYLRRSAKLAPSAKPVEN